MCEINRTSLLEDFCKKKKTEKESHVSIRTFSGNIRIKTKTSPNKEREKLQNKLQTTIMYKYIRILSNLTRRKEKLVFIHRNSILKALEVCMI